MALREEDLNVQIDEYVARSQQLTGKRVQERQSWNTEVTMDAIRHFVYGTDDDNPLWTDPDYAKETTFGDVLAPPAFLVSVMYPILHGAPVKAPLASLIGGVECEWFQTIRLGDRLRAEAKQKDFYEKRNKAGRRLNFVISEITYLNQRDEIVGIASGTMIMASQQGDALMFERPIRHYSESELASLLERFRAEQRTGGQLLVVEDVVTGTEIPPIYRGPLTIGDMVAWNAGIGPSYKAGRWGYLDLQKSLHSAVQNPATGFWVKNSQQHEDFNLAAGRGMPGPFDNGVMRFGWVCPLLTNWMGDGGFLKKISVQVRKPQIYGDTTCYSAKIVGKDDSTGVVKLEIQGTNQEQEINTVGTAEVVLPVRS